MNDFYTYILYFKKIGGVLKTMISNPKGLLALVPVIAAPELTTVQKALWVLAGLFVIDFITGIMASYAEFRRSLPVLPGSGKRYVIQSSKLRLSAMKFIAYGLTVLVAFAIEWAFVAKEFEPHSSLNKMTLTTIVIAFLCTVEIYSIVFENFKRMGFDVIQVVKSAAANGWGVYKAVKNDKSE